MRIFIDGYNLAFKLSSKKTDNIREGVTGIMLKFSALRPDALFTLVWDGKEDYIRKEKIAENLDEIFTKEGISADKYLIDLAREKDADVIVTSDSKVFSKSTNHGAICIFSEEFMALMDSVINERQYSPVFRNRKNESKRQKVIRELL